MNPLDKYYEFLDGAMADALAKASNPSCCSKGCFHCCREPAYASRREIRYLLSIVPPDQLPELKKKTEQWLKRFQETRFVYQKVPRSVDYRPAFLWCPLLAKDGTCSVYDRRPPGCRMFYALAHRKGCEDDELYKNQPFIKPTPTAYLGMDRHLMSLEIEDGPDTYDHIGILLAEELLGGEYPTSARMVFARDAHGELQAVAYKAVDG